MGTSERAYLRYRRSVIELWPESPRKQAYLEGIAWREEQLDCEDDQRRLIVGERRKPRLARIGSFW